MLVQSSGYSFRTSILEPRELTNWGVYADEQLVGLTGFRNSDHSFYTYLLRRGSRGQGLGTRASRLMIATAFALEQNLQEVCTVVDKGNEVSLAIVTRKLGMVKVPTIDPPHPSFVLSRPELPDQSMENFVRALGETSLVEVSVMIAS
jgi:RimJ/RimL family protein N-acetyltransferase